MVTIRSALKKEDVVNLAELAEMMSMQ